MLACRPCRRGRACPHGIRLSCTEKHTRDDHRLGEPLCPECYDCTGSVLFNAYAPELWRRFTITLRRTLARQARLTGKAFAAQVRVSYAKVAEYQRRGVVHFHAIIRLDGPAGPTTAPPSWATLGLLTGAIDQAAPSTQRGLFHDRKGPLSWEPPIGIEPMTYALRGACSRAAHALAAQMAPVIALMALAALGLSGDDEQLVIPGRGRRSPLRGLPRTVLSVVSAQTQARRLIAADHPPQTPGVALGGAGQGRGLGRKSALKWAPGL